jgi:oligopeptide/dipeptide ABC transporter ATP-binding protein
MTSSAAESTAPHVEVGTTCLAVEGLRLGFGSRAAEHPVLDDVHVTVRRGEMCALVGESGSGKSLTALTVMGLLPPGAVVLGGTVRFEGDDLLKLSRRERRSIRGSRIGMIFQEPMSSLNPSMKVGRQIQEVIEAHLGLTRRQSRRRAIDLLGLVGVPAPGRRVDDYPHTFSGGMRQRVMIAMAIACSPRLLIADEPTTALDVTVQAQVLELISRLRTELEMSVLLITHDLGVVGEFCDRTVVLYAGQTVERGPTRDVFERPKHPYTAGLLASLPRLEDDLDGNLRRGIPGAVPNPTAMPSGCRFHPRCFACLAPWCTTESPALAPHSVDRDVRCVRQLAGHELNLMGL